jgi:hypothetical protein
MLRLGPVVLGAAMLARLTGTLANRGLLVSQLFPPPNYSLLLGCAVLSSVALFTFQPRTTRNCSF